MMLVDFHTGRFAFEVGMEEVEAGPPDYEAEGGLELIQGKEMLIQDVPSYPPAGFSTRSSNGFPLINSPLTRGFIRKVYSILLIQLAIN
jgi:hypothetical protein